MPRRSFAATLVAATAAALTLGAAGAATTAAPGGDYTEAPATQTQSEYYVVVFRDPPAASYTGGIKGLKATKPERGEKLNARAAEVRTYGDHLRSVHANYRSYLSSKAGGTQVVRENVLVANAVAVKANGASKDTLQQGPGVKYVTPSALYRPTMTISNELIDADQVWPTVGGRANAGSGIKVGIIDTGIRDDHPAFACKTIEHDVFASGVSGFGPDIVFNHGTHVAGTVAGCVTDLSGPEDGPTSGTFSGVAPGATLHDYNVFPGYGGGYVAFGGSAFSHDICAAAEQAVADGMDVINMSLGGKVQGPHDYLAECIDAVVDAGVVAAVAAGNSGPGDSTVESPGTAPKALTAGASTNPHFVGIPASGTKTGGGAFTYGAALGDFENFDPAVTAAYTVTTPANGCTAITNAVSGKIALIDRGACTFTTKVRNAQNAGAVGVLVVNNVAGDPTAMAADGTTPEPTIPAAMLGKAEGNAIKPSGSVTVDGTSPQEFLTDNEDIVAGFSSRGPTPFTHLVKPDVTGPGVNVYSAVFDEANPSDLGWAYFQGTSMATPHVAGAAALLLASNGDLAPADVKSALVQTAKRPVYDHVNGTNATGPLVRGGGRIDVDAAVDAPLSLDPASVTFGQWSGNKAVSASVKVIANDIDATADSCSVSVDGSPYVSVSTASLAVAANGTATFTVTLNAGRNLAAGDYSGDVTLTCGATTLKAPWFVRKA